MSYGSIGKRGFGQSWVEQFWGNSGTSHQLQNRNKILWGWTASEVRSEGKACFKGWESPFIFQAVCMSYLFYRSFKPLLWWVGKNELVRLTLLALGELLPWDSAVNLPLPSREHAWFTQSILLYNFQWSQWELCAWSQGQNLAQREYNSSSALPNEIHLESGMHSWMQ